MGTCYFCGTPIEPPVYRRSVCAHCGKELKICLNCEFYSPGSHWDCHETIPEPVRDKDKANFCDYFKVATKATKNRQVKKAENSGSQRQAFDDLFKD